jgi:hypothetical protein
MIATLLLLIVLAAATPADARTATCKQYANNVVRCSGDGIRSKCKTFRSGKTYCYRTGRRGGR